MTVYPFYVEAVADGRSTPIKGGTKQKDGCLVTHIYQRNRGEITNPYKISQFPCDMMDDETGKLVHRLVTHVYYQGELIHSHITDY